MPDEGQEPYSVEPPDGDDRKTGETPAERERRARIEAPGLLSGFEKDADFDRDPELERVVMGPSRREEPGADDRAEARDTREEFTLPGFGNAKVWGIAGAVLLVSAMVATAINAPNSSVARVILTLYNVLLHTGTGVVALFIAALLSDKRLGLFELAAARMFAAVAGFALVFHLHINLLGERYDTKIEELLLAAMVYLLVVTATFRLWDWRPLTYVVGAHFFLWLTVYVGMQLAAHVGAAGS